MIEVINDKLVLDGHIIGGEDEVYEMMIKADKYDEIQARKDSFFIRAELAAEQHEMEVVGALGSFLGDD